MFSLIIAVVYLSAVSLGLPDSLLGAAWPVMHLELGAELSFAGVITMIISSGTIISSLASDRITKKFGAGLVTAVSTALTALALLGFSLSHTALLLCVFAIPYGLGAGSVDAALNNYVALHFSARHMSWFHCFWGVGASISPYIMSCSLSLNNNWRGGYQTVSILQLSLTVILFLSLPLWKKAGSSDTETGDAAKSAGIFGSLKIRGVPYMMTAFFAYCSLEGTTGLWASSYLVNARGIDADTAARFASLFYLGITAGRFIGGFIADRLGDKMLIRAGSTVMLCGMVMVMIPLELTALAGLIIIGIGCAPIYPSIIHSTPTNFGKENSQAVIGIQMASAYTGSTFVPPIFGLIANHVNIVWYPFFLAAFALLMLAMTEQLNAMFKHRYQGNFQ